MKNNSVLSVFDSCKILLLGDITRLAATVTIAAGSEAIVAALIATNITSDTLSAVSIAALGTAPTFFVTHRYLDREFKRLQKQRLQLKRLQK